MACPFFYPVEPLPEPESRQRGRVPLGVLCEGVCQADAENPVQPENDTLLALCNSGYGRGLCARFPAEQTVVDAVRFSLTGGSAGEPERIVYILEGAFAPVGHGTVELQGGAFPDERIARQAAIFVRHVKGQRRNSAAA